MGRELYKEQGLAATSRRLGKSKAYLSVMKKTNPEWFNYMESLHKDLFKAHKKYEQLNTDLKKEVKALYDELRANGKVGVFYKVLLKLGITTNIDSAYTYTYKTFARGSDGFHSYKTYRNMLKVRDEVLKDMR